RGKFPNDTEGHEMAVTDNATYRPPQRLSKQSIEGATVGSEAVTVPAGSFNAKKVVFGDMAQSHTWYIVDSVPGGTVKQTAGAAQGGDGKHHMVMELAAYGNNATSELGVK
ncbi:MAG: hypothetical protein JST92_01135, partial [Deltaproteobacteria bacterium]|nr:hypothetical protein [Deltaproteobacteria bacterium]